MAMSAAKVLARRYGLDEGMVTLATAMTANEAAQFLGVSKKVGGAIAGSDALDIAVTFNAYTSGWSDDFDIVWTRADKPKNRTVAVAGSASTTITPIPTGTSCSVVSVTPQSAAPAGWRWGTTSYNPTDKEVKIVEGANATITVTPTIIADALEISVVLVDDDESGYNEDFTVSYTVDDGDPVEVEIAAGDSLTLPTIPVGSVVVVSAAKPTPDPEGFVWLDPVLNPVDGEVTIVASATETVTVTFEIEAETP